MKLITTILILLLVGAVSAQAEGLDIPTQAPAPPTPLERSMSSNQRMPGLDIQLPERKKDKESQESSNTTRNGRSERKRESYGGDRVQDCYTIGTQTTCY